MALQHRSFALVVTFAAIAWLFGASGCQTQRARAIVAKSEEEGAVIDELAKEICEDAAERMGKTLLALEAAFAKIRTGRAHPSLLDTISVPYYGTDTPLKQVANIVVEDGRTLLISPWEKKLIPAARRSMAGQPR